MSIQKLIFPYFKFFKIMKLKTNAAIKGFIGFILIEFKV